MLLSRHTSNVGVCANGQEVDPAETARDVQREEYVDGLAQAVQDKPDLGKVALPSRRRRQLQPHIDSVLYDSVGARLSKARSSTHGHTTMLNPWADYRAHSLHYEKQLRSKCTQGLAKPLVAFKQAARAHTSYMTYTVRSSDAATKMYSSMTRSFSTPYTA